MSLSVACVLWWTGVVIEWVDQDWVVDKWFFSYAITPVSLLLMALAVCVATMLGLCVCGGMWLCVTMCRCVARGRGGWCLFGLLQRSFTHMMFVHVRGYATACRGKWTAADCR